MRLYLKRRYKREEYTIGHLYVDGKYLCDTLEDKVRNLPSEPKVYAQTAIPAGEYEVRLTYSPRFRRMLPILLNVPYFEGIRIHRGNTTDDTAGCILPGENLSKGRVENSTIYEKKICALLDEAEKRGEKTTIKIE